MSIATYGLLVGAGYLQVPLPRVETDSGQHFAAPSSNIANFHKQDLAYSVWFAAWKIGIILGTCK